MMRSLLLTVVVSIACLAGVPGAAEACTREDFAKAVNGAAAALRKLNAENAPRLQERMRQLQKKMGWPEAGYEERAFQAVQDERIAALDADANERLARIDTLGTVSSSVPLDCTKLQELEAASLELQATVKAKASYMLARLDQMLADSPVAPQKPKIAEPKPPAPKPAPPKAESPAPPPAAKADKPGKSEPQRDVAVVPPTPAPAPPPLSSPQDPAGPAQEDGYTIDEIRAASAGLFGQVSANLASVIEHVFQKAGRPTGYVLGSEGGGALLAGVRYGKGTLYLRGGGTQPIFWHGPSLGFDVGGEGSKTLFLIYRMGAPDQLFSTFTGIDGSAYLVGGVGATLVTNGSVIIAPIRSGLGLRLGASIGYIRFTPQPTWNPF